MIFVRTEYRARTRRGVRGGGISLVNAVTWARRRGSSSEASPILGLELESHHLHVESRHLISYAATRFGARSVALRPLHAARVFSIQALEPPANYHECVHGPLEDEARPAFGLSPDLKIIATTKQVVEMRKRQEHSARRTRGGHTNSTSAADYGGKHELRWVTGYSVHAQFLGSGRI